jgi:hypothetical protein
MPRRIAALVFLFALIGSPVAAQDGDDGALLDLLQHVPSDAVETGGLVTYVDLRAVETARPGAITPDSFEAWDRLDDDQLGQWVAAYQGVNSGSPRLLQEFASSGGDWPGVVGFDFFDIDRMLVFGQPPDDGLVLGGRFDTSAIVDAFVARGFSSTDEADGTLICPAAGCDTGLAMDLSNRETADPFGGSLGRQQPLVAAPDMLLSAAALGTINAMRDAASGATGSLGQTSEARAALATLAGDAVLRQAAFIAPEAIGGSAGEDTPALPPYEMLLFADTASATEQIAHVVLVYRSGEEAQAAADVLPARIDQVGSDGSRGALRTQLEERGLTGVEISVSEAPDGNAAAVDVAFHGPLAGADASSMDTPSSGLYQHLFRMLLTFDSPWLVSAGS